MANTGLRRYEALMLRKEWELLGERLRILSTEGASTKSAGWRDGRAAFAATITVLSLC